MESVGNESEARISCDGFEVECRNLPASNIVLRRQVGQEYDWIEAHRAVHPDSDWLFERSVGTWGGLNPSQLELVLCDECGEKAFKKFQEQPAVKGWLEIPSEVAGWVVLPLNDWNRKKHRQALASLPPGGFDIQGRGGGDVGGPEEPEAPETQRPVETDPEVVRLRERLAAVEREIAMEEEERRRAEKADQLQVETAAHVNELTRRLKEAEARLAELRADKSDERE